MLIPLDGVVAFIVFVFMMSLAVLIMIAAGILKKAFDNHAWFLKLSMVAITFFIIGLVGFTLSSNAGSRDMKILWDSHFCWIAFIAAAIISVLVLIKKKNVKN